MHNYGFITNDLYVQGWVLICVLVWETKVAHGKDEGAWECSRQKSLMVSKELKVLHRKGYNKKNNKKIVKF